MKVATIRTSSVFAGLAAAHAAGFLFAPEPLGPLLANSVYLPLTLLKMLGLPVYANAQAWGWAAPSSFGWLAVAVIWGVAWWAVARVVTRWFGCKTAAMTTGTQEE